MHSEQILFYFTVQVLIFVTIVGIHFCSSAEKHKFVDSRIRGFDDSVIQFKVNNPFCWESNFVFYITHKIHENWYPTNNSTFKVVKTLPCLRAWWTRCQLPSVPCSQLLSVFSSLHQQLPENLFIKSFYIYWYSFIKHL